MDLFRIVFADKEETLKRRRPNAVAKKRLSAVKTKPCLPPSSLFSFSFYSLYFSPAFILKKDKKGFCSNEGTVSKFRLGIFSLEKEELKMSPSRLKRQNFIFFILMKCGNMRNTALKWEYIFPKYIYFFFPSAVLTVLVWLCATKFVSATNSETFLFCFQSVKLVFCNNRENLINLKTIGVKGKDDKISGGKEEKDMRTKEKADPISHERRTERSESRRYWKKRREDG